MMMALAAGLTLVPAVSVDARSVTAGDLLTGIDGRRYRGAAAARAVLRLPAGRARMTLPAAAVAAQVRRAIGVTPRYVGETVAVVVRPRPAAARPAGAAPAAPLAAGTTLTLRSVTGPVTIERAVTTLQPGRSGRRVFVRDGAGQVFAAPLVLATAGERR